MAPSYKKTFTTALWASENRPTALAGEGMQFPLWWLAPPPSPRRGDFILRYALSEGIALQSFILPPEQGWQGNTIRKEAKRPENRVTRFPVEKSGAAG